MKTFPRPLVFGAGLLAAVLVRATTVIPPSFDDLVSRAQLIFQGTVTDVRSEWVGEGGQRHIRSLVTLKVDDSVKGKPGNQVTLEMMGGTVGTETMVVSDAPTFKVGDRDILFVENNGTQFVPLVGIMHGRYRVQKNESGQDAVFTNEGKPLTSIDQVGREEEQNAAGAPITLQDFKRAIQDKVSHLPQ